MFDYKSVLNATGPKAHEHLRSVQRTACSLANSSGGFILFGVQERLEARITHEQKELLQHAAMLEGTTLTDFIVRSAQRAAEQVIRDHALLVLTARESQAFVEALLNPPEPNAVLRAAADDYRRVMLPG